MFHYEGGQESRVVVEKENYARSIFHDQYRRALNLMDSYLRDTNVNTLRIVCFNGERGVGKTSCMMTVMGMAATVGDNDISGYNAKVDFLTEIRAGKVLETTFYCPDIIDPSFFDPSHNLLEILIGSLYGSLKEEVRKSGLNTDRVKLRDLQKSFEDVKRGIFNLHKESKDTYSDLTELDMLASAVELKEKIRDLFGKFLDFTHRDVLLLTIDDIDLCPHGAYEMCEQIRKYLAMPECIILMSAKYEQLENVITTHFSESLYVRHPFRRDFDVESMAQRYLTKLLPVGTRVNMPSVYDICNEDMRVTVVGKEGNNPKFEQYRSIRLGIPELIFRKTRYLFYNSNVGGISLIVPNNLRQFNALLGLLYSMEEIDDDSADRQITLQRNDAAFKDYFYNVWTDNLPFVYKSKIIEWVQDTPIEALNKSVLSWLKETFSDELNRKYGDEEGVGGDSMQVRAYSAFKNKILDNSNFSYNVTVGDVFFILSLMELDTHDISKVRMLFFIRSLYSIALFECYDIDTYNLDYPTSPTLNEDETGLYRADKRFENTMELQRLVLGSYFSFMPGEFLPRDESGAFNFDTRVINGSGKQDGMYSLVDLLQDCHKIIDSYDVSLQSYKELKKKVNMSLDDVNNIMSLKTKLDRDEMIFQLGEFFILTISRSIGSKSIESFYNGTESYRSTSIPAFFSQFNVHTGYYVFNVLAPFFNLINPDYTYGRFKEITGDMLTFALNHEFSLLYKIINQGIQARQHIWPCNYRRRLHCMMSDVVIRNGEVLGAMRDNLKSSRYARYGRGALAKIAEIYAKIYKSGMKTHLKSASGEDDRYSIDFKFLIPLAKFVRCIDEERSDTDEKNTGGDQKIITSEFRDKFYSIFDYLENRRAKDKSGTGKGKNKSKQGEDGGVELSEKMEEQLSQKLLEIFGFGEIGDARTVVKKLKTHLPDKNLSDSIVPYLKGKEAGKNIPYSVYSIITSLKEWNDSDKIKNWLDLFDLTNE